MTPLFWKGRKTTLQETDIWKIDPKYGADNVTKELSDFWEEERALALKAGRKASLVNALSKLVRRQILFAGFLRLIDFSYLGGPLLIKYLVAFVADSQNAASNNQELPNIGIGLGYAFGILALVVVGTLLQNRYYQLSNIHALRAQSALTSMIFHKATRLTAAARQEFTSGKVTNMVSSDVNRVTQFLLMCNQIWMAPIQIAIILGFLIAAIGPAAIAGVALLILISPLQKLFMTTMRAIRAAIAPLTDTRVKLTQESIQGIRVIKYFTWETPMQDIIEAIRKKEIAKILARSLLNAFVFTLAFSIPVLSSTISFVVYAVTYPDFNPGNLFSALALFNQLRFPLMFLPSILASFADFRIAIKRMEELLEAPELDWRPTLDKNSPNAVTITNAEFVWDAPPLKAVEPSTDKSGKAVVLKEPVGEDITMQDMRSTAFKLTDLNMVVPRGKLVAVVGPVGSGKSSLLNALIAEMKRVSGDVVLSGSLGYAAQEAWIKNATIRDNIIFGLPYDKQRYLKALRDCALETDLEVFEDGDLTSIGERGINLSGGQKQRINLARLVYFNSDIVLMDDPLSAVDAHVGKHLFEDCLQGALKEKTRILVTHQLHFLPSVDYIFVMKDGTIKERGTYAELIGAGGAFSTMIQAHGSSDSTAREANLMFDTNTEAIDRIDAMLEIKHTVAAKNQMQTEDREVGAVKTRVWSTYIEASGGWLFAVGLVLILILTQGARIGTDYWLVIWANRAIPSFNQGQYIGYFFLWSVVQTIIFYMSGVYMAYAGTRAARVLHAQALKRILRAPVLYFDRTPLGRILNRFSKDTDGVDSMLMDSIRMFTITLSAAIGILILIIVATPIFLAPLVPVLGLYYYVQKLYRMTNIELKRIDSVTRSPLYAQIGESLTGMATIRAYGEEGRFVAVNRELIDGNIGPFYIMTVAGRWLGLRLEVLGGVLVFFATVLGILARGTPGYTPALFGITLSYALQVTGNLNWSVRQFTEVENAMNAVERIAHYGEHLDQEAPAKSTVQVPKGWPHEGSVEFENVSFTYSPELPAVLKKVSFKLAARTKTGICGRTGSGKSSLIQALFRMADPLLDGRILIDGIDIATLGLDNLRSNLSIIPQDPVLFSGDFRRNLDPFGMHTDEELWAALDTACLKPKIIELGGLDSRVQAGGENLSVGQRQLLCLARAMLTKPRVLIMDEATANIDFETDSIIQRVLATQLTNATIITVAHRLVL